MSTIINIAPSSDRELVLARIIDAPRASVYRAWTDPELLKEWFVPKPWVASHVELDLRPGGSSLIVMKSPEGDEFPNPGVFLEIRENEKIVMTDAFTKAWEPSEKAFMTVIIPSEDADDGKRTRYVARARHWTTESREEHEKMGFHEGWGQVADQLEEVAKRL